MVKRHDRKYQPLAISAGDLPALQEITGDGDRGETFVTGDATSLADVLEELGVVADDDELAVAAEELGADGAFFRVHHFAPQFSSPIALLSAMAAVTKHIEVGTGVLDMR